MRNCKFLLVAGIVVANFSFSAFARDACILPDKISSPSLVGVDCKNNIKPDSYVLSLSWSPEYCLGAKEKDYFQCKLNSFQFVVHGLWGQNDQANGKCDQPRNCSESLVDDLIVKKTLCTVPGVELIQGEWQKHGTCTGMSADKYFDKTRELWEALVKPDLTKIVGKNNQVTAGDIVKAFVSDNKDSGLFQEAIAVQVGKKARLSEVLICYDLQYKYKACSIGKTPDKQVIRITAPKKN